MQIKLKQSIDFEYLISSSFFRVFEISNFIAKSELRSSVRIILQRVTTSKTFELLFS